MLYDAAQEAEDCRLSLTEAELHPDPMAQFGRWFQEAQQNPRVTTPEALALATTTPDGAPSLRMVLLKGFDARGFVFYTNYESRKAGELQANPRAALALYWEPLHRQVRIEGSVERISQEESERYFRSRPRESQTGASVSPQSRVIPDRDELDRAYQRFLAAHEAREIPLPEHWGGYRVAPRVVEFWQGRTNRLHDRLRYTRRRDNVWTIERLGP